MNPDAKPVIPTDLGPPLRAPDDRPGSLPAVGDKLKNGAILLAARKHSRLDRWIVLALHAGAGAVSPFVTWEFRPGDGLTYWGHYHDDLFEALGDYAERG